MQLRTCLGMPAICGCSSQGLQLACTSHVFVDVGALSNFRYEGAKMRTVTIIWQRLSLVAVGLLCSPWWVSASFKFGSRHFRKEGAQIDAGDMRVYACACLPCALTICPFHSCRLNGSVSPLFTFGQSESNTTTVAASRQHPLGYDPSSP